MAETSGFHGFSRETIVFFRGLKKNNNREWFESHREVYESHVLDPAKAFVAAMGRRLKEISPHIVAVPRINKSIFRLNRDTRFSLDKSPYKPNLGLYFWEGPRSRMESPGFYFHLEPPKFLLAVGYYVFPDWLIGPYRKAVVDPRQGRELAATIQRILEATDFKIGGRHYKRIPPGFDASHPNSPLLLHNGLHAWREMRLPEELFNPGLVDYCLDQLVPLAPLYRWCVALLGRAHPPSPRIPF
jgi:uncharacterized protein (TIGR02453 family)